MSILGSYVGRLVKCWSNLSPEKEMIDGHTPRLGYTLIVKRWFGPSNRMVQYFKAPIPRSGLLLFPHITRIIGLPGGAKVISSTDCRNTAQT